MFLAKGVEAAGYKTGLYTSPHLCDYRERFTLAGTFFTETQLLDAANELLRRLEGFTFIDQWGTSEPTAFELYTSYAYILFSLAGCQWAVIETGLGGRLDATNATVSEAAIITPIELEHTAILGHTIPLIAAEKAKIIKEGTPLFLSRQKPEAREVFIQEALEQHSRIYELPLEVEVLSRRTTMEGEHVTITWKDQSQTNLLLRMRGEVQAENCALALLVLKTLNLYVQGKTERALEQAQLPGRMELIDSSPALVIDGAHTVESLRHLVNSFVQLFGLEGNTLIYGALEDKDHRHMALLLLPVFDTIIICRPGTFKKSDPAALHALFLSMAGEMIKSPTIYLEEEADDALALAYRLTCPHHAILATGSFYLAGEIVTSHATVQRRADVPELA